MPTLPTPNVDALEHSATLLRVIKEEIAAAGGYISFARFMELALYAPGLGYYSAGNYKFGKQGDFVTAPEISNLFAKCVAKQCQQILTALTSPDILELGAGSGKLAGDLLQELEQLQCLPRHYYILEISADLRAKQNIYLEKQCPQFLSRIIWLDELPCTGFKGVILANEVIDAMPVHCFYLDNNNINEYCVTLKNNNLHWLSTPPTTPALEQQLLAIQKEFTLPNHYQSEVNLLAPVWITTLSDILTEGVILLFDYGYNRREYYHPERTTGTLMCFYQHHRHTNPFELVGLQDISAHVDFTTLAESASAANASVSGYTTQAGFLLACGLMDLTQTEKLSAIEQYQQNQAIKLLTLPSQMGELIKVMALSKNIDLPLLGFSLFDRRRDL
jgi:SAM-dependent MidA family methyltransferase